MCILHKWEKWKSHSLEHFRRIDGEKQVVGIEKRQKRKCEKCGKEQDRRVAFLY